MLNPDFPFRGIAKRPSAFFAGLLAVSLTGCVHPISDGGTSTYAHGGDLEVRAFQGGYGIDFYEKAAKEYEAGHPGVHIDVKGDPRIWEQLRPRFVAGEPPSLTFPGWGMDHYALIYENQVLPLDDALLTTPYGETTGTWKDTFYPDILKEGVYENQTYLLPFYVNLNGWWYNVDLFEKNGWKPPKTWDELLTLCEEIKAKGIAPITYQGKYPAYALQGFVLPWAISIGGIEALRDAESLKEGAWSSPAFLKAAEMTDELREKGYFENGANGLTHTEAQMDFLNGKAAMIPCGTWLGSEMKKQMPPGFRMAFFLPPVVAGGKGEPTALQVGIEPWLVPAQGHNPALAIDFFKYMTSKPKAREFVLEKGTLTAVKGTADGELPPNLRGPAQCLKDAKITYTTRYSKWYPTLDTEAKNAMASLLQGAIKPKQFVDQIEGAAAKVRRDPNIPKHQLD